MTPRALITGITGQDGSYLAELLLAKGYEVQLNSSEKEKRKTGSLYAIVDYEQGLVRRLLDGLAAIPGVTIHGIVDPARAAERVPTVSISIDGVRPHDAAESMGRDGIFVWDGDFYATGLIERLGKAESGGVLRLGLVHYNTAEEVDRTLGAVGALATAAIA